MASYPRIRILDSISDPGNPTKANEDRFGCNHACAFVIDGATGLGDRQYVEEAASDAAWIAQKFADGFQRNVTLESRISDVARALAEDARADFLGRDSRVPRYAWPLTTLAMVHANGRGFEFVGLGDSCLFLLRDSGEAGMHTAIPGAHQREQEHARRHIVRTGGIVAGGGALADAQTLDALRRHRESQNTAGSGVWTLGLVPEAADHLVRDALDITGTATGIVCSDGLADLVFLYEAYDAGSLVRAARDNGLAALVEELRRFERDIDPEGHRYPRFKQSDDTTALLIELTSAA